MLSYTKRCVNSLTLFLTILVFILFILFQIKLEEIENNKGDLNKIAIINKYNNNYAKQVYFNSKSLSKAKQENRIIQEQIRIAKQRYKQTLKFEESNIKEKAKQESKKVKQSQKPVKINMYRTNKWRIKIPKLKIDAPITEGTSQEALRRTVGHFEGSSKWNGNIALAGHNRGYRCNFFQEIKKLQNGDEIIYSTSIGEKKYKVITNKIIKETDWSYIKNTKENKITLITCEENKREYRRCIQAIEIK